MRSIFSTRRSTARNSRDHTNLFPRDPHRAPAPGGIVAPEEFNPSAWMVADQRVPVVAPLLRDTDTMEKAIGVLGPGLANQVNGGIEVSYLGPIRPGDVIRSRTRLVEYREKAGRMGPMLVSLTESVWTNRDGEQVRVERQTAIRY